MLTYVWTDVRSYLINVEAALLKIANIFFTAAYVVINIYKFFLFNVVHSRSHSAAPFSFLHTSLYSSVTNIFFFHSTNLCTAVKCRVIDLNIIGETLFGYSGTRLRSSSGIWNISTFANKLPWRIAKEMNFAAIQRRRVVRPTSFQSLVNYFSGSLFFFVNR